MANKNDTPRLAPFYVRRVARYGHPEDGGRRTPGILHWHVTRRRDGATLAVCHTRQRARDVARGFNDGDRSAWVTATTNAAVARVSVRKGAEPGKLAETSGARDTDPSRSPTLPVRDGGRVSDERDDPRQMRLPLTGHDAIAFAERHGTPLCKHADPVEGARVDVTVDEARAIAREDAGLLYVDDDGARRTPGTNGEPASAHVRAGLGFR